MLSNLEYDVWSMMCILVCWDKVIRTNQNWKVTFYKITLKFYRKKEPFAICCKGILIGKEVYSPFWGLKQKKIKYTSFIPLLLFIKMDELF